MTDEQILGFWKIAETNPDRLAVVDPDYNEITYGELADRVNQLSNGLLSLGLKKGDQVTTVLPNCIEQLMVGLAIFQCGFYITTVNWHLSGPEISYIAKNSETKVLIADEGFAEEVKKVLEADDSDEEHADFEIPNLYSKGKIDGFKSLDELLEGQSTERPDELHTGSFMFYTSGTTGRPRGVRRGLPEAHPDESAGASGGLFFLLGIMPHDDNVHITQAPLYHTAVNVWTTTSLHMGHSVVLMDRWTPEGALERIDKYKVTQSHMVPTMFHRLLALPKEEKVKYDVSSLRRMIHAAAPCPVETKQKMLDWWGNCIWEYYAATEGGGTYVSAEDWRKYPGTVGVPWPGSTVIVVDEEGNELPPGESGTIYMKTAMSGADFEYYKDDEKTNVARLRDMFTVGDVGYFNKDGYLFLNDRSNDMIISGGVNIYPAEIEGALHQCDLIEDVAVFGVPDPDKGEAIKAVVQTPKGVAHGDETSGQIMEFIREKVGKQKWPHSIDFIDELPRDPNGKLYKRRLRDPYWADQERKI